MIELKSGTRIWIAAGFTDLRRGFQGLSSIVETVLEQAPLSGHVFVLERISDPVNRIHELLPWNLASELPRHLAASQVST